MVGHSHDGMGRRASLEPQRAERLRLADIVQGRRVRTAGDPRVGLEVDSSASAVRAFQDLATGNRIWVLKRRPPDIER
jgi:hypothetical protein